jgi:hypothetical protein
LGRTHRVVIEPCDWIQANFGTIWRDPILDASKLDNGTVGPNYFCKSTGGRLGRNNKAENTPGATAVRPGKTRRGA